MKNNRLNQFLFALILSLGILFGHTSMVLAEGEDLTEESTESVGNPSTSEETPVVDETPKEENLVAVFAANFDPDQDYNAQGIVEQGEAYLSEGFDSYIEESDDSANLLEVEGAIIEAGAAEAGTIVVAQPIDEEYKEPIVENEKEAIQYDADANEHLANAVAEGVKTEVEIAKEGVEITKDVVEVGIDYIGVEVAAGQAADAKEDAQENYNEALNAETREEAQAAADKAQENANKAQAAAEVALAKAQEAANKATEASEAYGRAQDEYNDAKAKIDAELEAGIISLEEARDRTIAAEEVARQYYEEMVAAQADAEAWTKTAKEASEAADAALVQSVEDLAKIVADNAKVVAGKTAIAAATGAAYEAAIIVENFAGKPVDKLNQSIAEVQELIDAMDIEITKAQKKYDDAVADVEQIKDSEDYKTAIQELNDAQASLDALTAARNAAQKALDEMKNASYADRMLELQEALNDTTLSDEDLLAIENELTEIIFRNNNDYTDEERERIDFKWNVQTIVDDYGNELPTSALDTEGSHNHYFRVQNPDGTKFFYQMSLVNILENNIIVQRILRYTPVIVEYDEADVTVTAKAVLNDPSLEKETGSFIGVVSYEYVKSNFAALLDDDSYDVYAFDSSISNEYYILNVREILNGITWKNALSKVRQVIKSGKSNLNGYIKDNYVLIDKTTARLVLGTEIYNSNVITNRWDAAQASIDELNDQVNDASIRVINAEIAVNKIIGEAEQAVKDAEEEKELLIEIKEGFVQAKEALIEERDGGTTDLLIRIGIKDGPETVTAELFEISILRGLVAVGMATEEQITRLNELNKKYNNIDFKEIDFDELSTIISNVNTVTDAIKKGKIDKDTIAAVKSLIEDTDFAPQTKLAIATAVKDYLANLHYKAVEDLENAVETGKQQIKDQNDIIEGNLVAAAIGKVVYAAAQKAELEAKAKTLYAKVVYEAAKLAHKKAEEALDAYRSFAENFDPNKGLLNLLSKETVAAGGLAFMAYFKAYDAQTDAYLANQAALNAQRIADSFYDIWVSGKQVNESNKNNVLGDEDTPSVVFDNETNTLYLNEANIEVKKIVGIDEDVAAGIYSKVGGLNIVVTGVNRIKSEASGIFGEQYNTVAGIYAVDANGNNAALKIKGTDSDESQLSIDLTNLDAENLSVGIVGDVSIKDIDLLEIRTGNVPTNEQFNTMGLAEEYPFSQLSSFIAPTSVGINGSVAIDNSTVNLLVGNGTMNYGIAGFMDKPAEIKNNSNLLIDLGDVSDSSTGISAQSLTVDKSILTVKSGNAITNNRSTTSSAIDPIHIIITDSIVEAYSGDANYSYAFFTLASEDIVFTTNEGVTNSWIKAVAGKGDEDGNAAILGHVKIIGDGKLYAIATEGEYGIGLSGRLTLNALGNPKIDLRGSKQAIDYLDGFAPVFEGRYVLVSDAIEDPETLVLWDGQTDLRSENFRWITLGFVEKTVYDVISGGDQTWTEGTASPLTVRIGNTNETPGTDTTSKHFVTAFVDDHELVKDLEYTARPGSIYIDLKPSYLNKLSAGKHTLRAVFNNGDDVVTHFTIAKNSSGGGSSSSKSSSSSTKASSVVTCQMAGYPNGYAWNEAAKACQPGYIDNNGVFHSYSTSARRNVPTTADEGVSPFYLIILMMFGAAGVGLLLKNESCN